MPRMLVLDCAIPIEEGGWGDTKSTGHGRECKSRPNGFSVLYCTCECHTRKAKRAAKRAVKLQKRSAT